MSEQESMLHLFVIILASINRFLLFHGGGGHHPSTQCDPTSGVVKT